MAKRLLFIFNPHTGGGRLQKELLGILCRLSAAGYEVTVHPTTAQGDAKQVAAERGAGFDLVVCCGGDGTLNEVVHGLMQNDKAPPLGYIPGGTTNDFAASLGLPKGDMLKAAERAVRPKQRFKCDVGIVNEERVFTYVAAFGAFTDVSYTTPQKSKNLMGYMAYLLEGVQRLPSLHPLDITVEIDGETLSEEILFGMVSNSTSVGGFQFPREGEIQLDDGEFELILVRRPHNLGDLAALSAALLTRNVESPYIVARHANAMRITGKEPVAWTLDGEFGGELTAADIHVRQKALCLHI